MNYFYPNSNTVIVQLPTYGFSGSMTELDRLADTVGIYGTVLDYDIQEQGPRTDVIFKVTTEK